MLFEIAYFEPDGSLHRGGVAATARTVGKWIEESVSIDPETVFVAIPASEEAIMEYKKG